VVARGLPGAWAAPEVDSVSKIAIEDLELIEKSPSKFVQTRDPTKTRGQSPKRGLCLELRLARPPPPTKDGASALGDWWSTDHDTGVGMSPHPPQD
jgi:hypothetical protein